MFGRYKQAAYSATGALMAEECSSDSRPIIQAPYDATGALMTVPRIQAPYDGFGPLSAAITVGETCIVSPDVDVTPGSPRAGLEGVVWPPSATGCILVAGIRQLDCRGWF